MRLIQALLIAGLILPTLNGCVPVIAAGAATGGLAAADRRTSGAYVEDEAIEWKISGRLRDALGTKIHSNITSYNRNVLITGEATDEATKTEAEKIAKGVENVNIVTNELAIGEASSISARSNDVYLTTKVKTRLISENRVSPHVVKVVTENSVVYLLGLVTRSEGDIAAEIARSTDGVSKVVKVFEYIQ